MFHKMLILWHVLQYKIFTFSYFGHLELELNTKMKEKPHIDKIIQGLKKLFLKYMK